MSRAEVLERPASRLSMSQRRARTRLTIQGWAIIGMATLAVLSTGWQPHAHASALALCMIIAAIIACFLVKRPLYRVSSSWSLPERIHAMEDTAIGLTLRATWPTPPLSLDAPVPGRDGHIERVPIVYLNEVGEAPMRTVYPARFAHRGRWTLPAPAMRCRHPFGLVEAQALVGNTHDILVLPALGRLEAPLRAELQRWLDDGPAGEELGDDEIDHLRQYRAGDLQRRIHWRASARNQNLLIAERRATTSRRLSILLDCGTRHGATSRRLERLISITATLVSELGKADWHVSLHLSDRPERPIIEDVQRMLESLAEVQPHAPCDLEPLIPDDRSCVVLTCQDAVTIAEQRRIFILTLDQAEQVVHPPRHR